MSRHKTLAVEWGPSLRRAARTRTRAAAAIGSHPDRPLCVPVDPKADSPLSAQTLPLSKRCIRLAAIPAKGEVLWVFLISILVRMSVDLGMLEVWLVPSGLLNHATYGQFVSFSMNIDECAIERFSDLAIDSKLRGCDVIKLKIGDVVSGGSIRNRATVVQQKTRRPVQFELMADCRKSLLAWLERRGGSLDDFVFPSRVNRAGHLSARQYARLVDEWVSAVGLNAREFGTHSLRRTKASLIYKATGNLRAVQILLGHSKIENTIRYLGVDIDDALTLAERTEI